MEINYSYQLINQIADTLSASVGCSDNSKELEKLDKLEQIANGWVVSSAERAAYINMLDAARSAISDISGLVNELNQREFNN